MEVWLSIRAPIKSRGSSRFGGMDVSMSPNKVPQVV